MAYITRDDGVRFVVPSYRDTLINKKPNLLKKEIMMLSSNYGEYITLQKKGENNYEVAFSPDTGYLLGESVWNYFKQPVDMVYCEVIPNTTEAILVIVKSGSVYLDGRFSLDSIPEELIIFKSQPSHFDIFIYGDVPISATPDQDRFSFDPSSVHSFTVLEEPAFPLIPTNKSLQLQLVQTVLTAQGIDALPIKKIATVVVILALLWMAWSYISNMESEPDIRPIVTPTYNPYQEYQRVLTSPAPVKQLHLLADQIRFLYTMPGWYPNSIEFTPGSTNSLRASVMSGGAKIEVLFDWAEKNNVQVTVEHDGIYITLTSNLINRETPKNIFGFQDVISTMVDRISYVLSGNSIQLSTFTDNKVFKQTTATINVLNISPLTLDLIGELLENLPLVLNKVTLKVNDGNLSGKIILQVLGN